MTERRKRGRRGDNTTNVFSSELETTVMGSSIEMDKAYDYGITGARGLAGKPIFELQKLEDKSKAASSALMANSADLTSPGLPDDTFNL